MRLASCWFASGPHPVPRPPPWRRREQRVHHRLLGGALARHLLLVRCALRLGPSVGPLAGALGLRRRCGRLVGLRARARARACMCPLGPQVLGGEGRGPVQPAVPGVPAAGHALHVRPARAAGRQRAAARHAPSHLPAPVAQAVQGSRGARPPVRTLALALHPAPGLLPPPAPPHTCRMLEYCYAANAVSFYHLFFKPQSAELRRVSAACQAACPPACSPAARLLFACSPHAPPPPPPSTSHPRAAPPAACHPLPTPAPPQFSFAIMTGPLMWSIVAMRNSLVFHDGARLQAAAACLAGAQCVGKSHCSYHSSLTHRLPAAVGPAGDKITTLMMHASPAICAW